MHYTVPQFLGVIVVMLAAARLLGALMKAIGQPAVLGELLAGILLGTSVLGLKEGGVDWAYDQYNEKLITSAMKAKVDAAKADIIAGKINVHDYMSDNSCK